MTDMHIHALDDALPFGARVTGLTGSQLKDTEVRAQLNQLFLDRGVIVFEGLEPSADLQVEVSTVFGPLKDHPVASVGRADANRLLGVIEIKTGPEAGIVEIDGKPLVTWQP